MFFWLPSPPQTPRRLLPLPSSRRLSPDLWNARSPTQSPTTPRLLSRYPLPASSPLPAKFLPYDGNTQLFQHTLSKCSVPAYFGPFRAKTSRSVREGTKLLDCNTITPTQPDANQPWHGARIALRDIREVTDSSVIHHFLV